MFRTLRGSSHDLPIRRNDGHFSTRRSAHYWRRWSNKQLVAIAVFAACAFLYLVTIPFRRDDPAPAKAPATPPPPPPDVAASPSAPRLPPLYSNFHRYELQLPQNNLELPYPEGKRGKYVWIANHSKGSGWGNIMQEQLLHAYLVHRTGRGFVYNNYTWNDDGSDYSNYNGKYIPSRIPTTALLQGPIVGTNVAPNGHVPRSIPKAYWDEVCPEPTIVRGEIFLHAMEVRWSSAFEITEAFVEYLNRLDARCIEIQDDSWNIYDLWLIGDGKRLLDIFPTLSQSPMITELGWSELVELGFDNNRDVISPSAVFKPGQLTSAATSHLGAERYPVIPGLLVLHVRRGDFEHHCSHLQGYRSSWLGFCSFPEFPDKWEPPEEHDSDEHKEYYRRHCYPDIQQIVEKVSAIRQTRAGKNLHNVYIMTNGPVAWVDELKRAIYSSGRWNNVASSRDITLTWEQKYVAQAIDMLVGQRAQVFVGNGFSSLTGVIAMLRMAYGVSPEATRMW